MSVQVLSLGSGPLPASTTSIYLSPTTPVALTTIIKSIRLVNKGSTATMNLYLKTAADGNDRRLMPPNFSISAGTMVIEDQEITMSPGDNIDADTTGTVDYLICGIQR